MNLEKVLNERIADFALMYVKLHRFHWYVQGPHFTTFHAIYEGLYNDFSNYLDNYAERLLAIGGTPVATLKGFLALSALSEEGDEVTPHQIGQTLQNDLGHIVKKLKDGIAVSDATNDVATSDLFTVTIADLEKQLWFIKQTLKQG